MSKKISYNCKMESEVYNFGTNIAKFAFNEKLQSVPSCPAAKEILRRNIGDIGMSYQPNIYN